MKYKSIYLKLVFLIISYSKIYAQLNGSEFIINAGIGYSPKFDGSVQITTLDYPVSINSLLTESFPINFSIITPSIGGMIDYCLGEKISVGIAGSYQSIAVTSYNFFADKITRTNIAVRLMVHLNKRHPLFDNYLGLRIGCSYWRDYPSILNYMNFFPPPQYFINYPSLLVPSFQFVYGMRFFFHNHFGLQFEAAIGSPYLFEGGVTFKINTRKSSSAPTPQYNYGGHEGK